MFSFHGQILQTVSARSESLKLLRPNEMVTFDCLNCLTDIISNASNKPGLVLQCVHILTNMGEECLGIQRECSFSVVPVVSIFVVVCFYVQKLCRPVS